MKSILIKKLKVSIRIMLAILLLGMLACNQKKKTNNTKPEEDKNMELSLQKKDDLLGETAKAICYSGYRTGQHPDRGNGAINPSYEEILEDLKILSEDAGFHLIRLYDCGINTQMTLQVIKENQLDIKVLLGIWLQAELSNHETCEWLTKPIPEKELKNNKGINLKEIEKGIELANKYKDIVIAINVGNEALVEWNDHKVDTDTVISYVNKVKQAIDQEVTVADNYKWWADHGKELAKAVDFISIHVYPVWEGKNIDEGLSYSIKNIQEVKDSLPGARIVITEVGWPDIASEFGERASEKKQEQYYHEIMNWCDENNITCFFFEAFDEDWKGNPNNPMGAEKHWGVFFIDRTPKKVMQEIINQ